MPQPPSGAWERGRFEVIRRILSFDPETGHIEERLEPDPRRYEWQDRPQGRVLYDRFDKTYMEDALVMDMLRQTLELDVPPPVPVLGDISAHIELRRPLIRTALGGGSGSSELSDASDELLASLAGDELGFVILSLDVVNSSALSNSTQSQALATYFGTLLTEASELVALFHGHVLRYAGDGLIAYFPEPSFIANNDFAIDCAVCLQRLVREAFNIEALAQNFPSIEIRVGLDAGEAAVRVLGSSRTKRHADIIGDVVSLASNIEAAAKPGEVLLGDVVERNLHITWRRLCEPVPPPPGWDFRAQDGTVYSLHKVGTDIRRPIEDPSSVG